MDTSFYHKGIVPLKVSFIGNHNYINRISYEEGKAYLEYLKDNKIITRKFLIDIDKENI